MNMNQLKPASELAQRFGVKMLVYGGAGTGKTPIVSTAPSPVLCSVEPGLLSMRDSTNIATWDAFSGADNAQKAAKIEEFFKWLFQSEEAKNFETVAIDSISQLAEIYLNQELARNKDGRQAYGKMSTRVMELVNGLYYLPNKHVYLIGKQAIRDENGVATKSAYFPGQDLNIKIPHLYDEILHIGHYNVPGQVGEVVAFRTKSTFGVTARDRSGRLDELEPPHLGNIITKCMS